MSKAILIIDMPASCGECQLYDPSYLDCEGADMSLYYEMPKDVERQLANAEDVQYKPKWCPLIEIEEWHSSRGNMYMPAGMFDEILGEEE